MQYNPEGPVGASTAVTPAGPALHGTQELLSGVQESLLQEALKPQPNPMPALFLAHGSPMNIIADNRYTRDLSALASGIPAPKAIIVVSAHWQTQGCMITTAASPRQIYDFGGFPERLYKVLYEAPGDPALAARMITILSCGSVADDETKGGPTSRIQVRGDPRRGIDHGAWSVLHHLYPRQDVPVLQLSLDASLTARQHFELGQNLGFLRDEGVLVIGSGNIVHSFDEVDFDDNAAALPWAIEFDTEVARRIDTGDTSFLFDLADPRKLPRRAFATTEHYLPMLYILALRRQGEALAYTHASIQNASMSMRCFTVGG